MCRTKLERQQDYGQHQELQVLLPTLTFSNRATIWACLIPLLIISLETGKWSLIASVTFIATAAFCFWWAPSSPISPLYCIFYKCQGGIYLVSVGYYTLWWDLDHHKCKAFALRIIPAFSVPIDSRVSPR